MLTPVHRALASPRAVVREAARSALLRPGSAAVSEVCRSALAELESQPTGFVEWCTFVAPDSALVGLLQEVDRSRGTPTEQVLVQQAARVGGHGVTGWARAALAQDDLATGLRAPCFAVLLRSGEAVDLDLAAELDAAQPFRRGVQTLVEGAIDGGTLLPAVHACIAHPVHGTEVLHTLQRRLLGRSASVSELSGCVDVAALTELGLVSGAGSFLAAVSSSFSAVQSGETAAWSTLAQSLLAQLDPLFFVEGGPPRHGRAQACWLRALLALGLPAAHPAAFTTIVVSLTACLVQGAHGDARFDEHTPGGPNRLTAARRPDLPAVEAAMVSGGPDAVPVLIEALDPSEADRTVSILSALARLAWQHPGCVDASVGPLLRLLDSDPGEQLLDGTTRLLRLLSPAAVDSVIAACPSQGDLAHPLASAIGAIGGPAARHFLLKHIDTVLHADHGVLVGLCALGDPAALGPLARLEPHDPTGEIACVLIILSELNGQSPPGLGGWRARLKAVEHDRQQRQNQYGNQLMAAALGQRYRPERAVPDPPKRARRTRREKRKKGKRRR